MSAVRIPVTGSSQPALVDPWNAWLADHRWHLNTHGYVASRFGRRLDTMHRIIVCPSPGLEVDHRNRDPLDNREANLREATRLQQLHNSYRPDRRNRYSPYKGVSYVRTKQNRRKRWVAQIAVPAPGGGIGRQWRIGYYNTAEEAAEAYDTEAVRYFGEFALTNKDLLLL